MDKTIKTTFGKLTLTDDDEVVLLEVRPFEGRCLLTYTTKSGLPAQTIDITDHPGISVMIESLIGAVYSKGEI